VDAKAALMHAHRNTIRRYRRLLETHLTDAERDHIEERLSGACRPGIAIHPSASCAS
jgi:hypothetical protein